MVKASLSKPLLLILIVITFLSFLFQYVLTGSALHSRKLLTKATYSLLSNDFPRSSSLFDEYIETYGANYSILAIDRLLKSLQTYPESTMMSDELRRDFYTKVIEIGKELIRQSRLQEAQEYFLNVNRHYPHLMFECKKNLAIIRFRLHENYQGPPPFAYYNERYLDRIYRALFSDIASPLIESSHFTADPAIDGFSAVIKLNRMYPGDTLRIDWRANKVIIQSNRIYVDTYREPFQFSSTLSSAPNRVTIRFFYKNTRLFEKKLTKSRTRDPDWASNVQFTQK